MKDIYKNPILYYILVPIVVALWSLFLWGVYLPGAEAKWKLEQVQYNKAQSIIAEILTLDPDRLEFAGSETGADKFDYASAVERIASLSKIPSTKYRLSSGIIMTSTSDGQKKKSQRANVDLKEVDIKRFARFLSAIQLRWANLQCVQVKLTKKKGLPDTWDVGLVFRYYY